MKEDDFTDCVHDQYGIDCICIIKGENGCSSYHQKQRTDILGIKVQVVDTVGAGDAFSAAFIYLLLKTGDPVRSAEMGNLMGTYVASRRRAVPEYDAEIIRQMGI